MELCSKSTEMPEIIVAGLNGPHITKELRALLEDQRNPVFCSRSQLDIVLKSFPQFDLRRWISIVPISACFEQIREKQSHGTVVVLVSGDPLFFGLGKRLTEFFPAGEFTFLPAVSFMQSCFSHFGISWDDAEFISLHGRPLASIDTRLNAEKLFIYTDPENSPETIANYLQNRLSEKDLEQLEMLVGECIGSEKQRFTRGEVRDIAAMSFAQPNCMILLHSDNQRSVDVPKFGLTEKEIRHSRGLITKNEVRAAAIHRLCLPEEGVFWDIGAGSGSLGLEAARINRSLSVFSIEKEGEQINNIRANLERYRCRNVSIVAGEAPAILETLPAPDRVFIGGSGGRLGEILDYLSKTVKADGRIVLTAVLPETAALAPEILHRHKFSVEISVIQVSRIQYPDMQEQKLNPIQIISGTKN